MLYIYTISRYGQVVLFVSATLVSAPIPVSLLYILEVSRIYAVSLLTYSVLLFYAYSCTSAPVSL